MRAGPSRDRGSVRDWREGSSMKPKYRKSEPRPLPPGESRPGRLPAERAWPHPGPYKRKWAGCRTCGFYWFPTVAGKPAENCPRCDRDMAKDNRLVSGTGVPADPRALMLCKCYRCGHEWFWKKRVPLFPKYCGNPNCTSPFWAWPRVLGTARKKAAAKVTTLPRGRRTDVVSDESRRAAGGGLQL